MKVYVENQCPAYRSMFLKEGWQVVADIRDADLVQFVGGADVTPSLYGEDPHPSTRSNLIVDGRSTTIFEEASRFSIPKSGICRGGQYLNVANGGSMWQNVDNHAIYGTHEVFDIRTGKSIQCSSTHHQMMKPSSEALIVAIVLEETQSSTLREGMHDGELYTEVTKDNPNPDIEVLFYKETRSLCFQPHPEFEDVEDCRKYYFELIRRHLGLGV